MRRVGLRARLAVSLVATALLAVGLAALIASLGLSPRINEAARARLTASAAHVADIAAGAYQASGGWTPGTRTELGHVASLDGLRISLQLPSGQVVSVGPAPTGFTARAAVMAAGRRVATVAVSAANGSLLSPEETHLAHSLDRLHLVAAALAALAALVAGLVLAQSLSRPLRRIRATAERLEAGELDARVEVGSEPEVGSVGRALNRLAETLEHEEELRRQNVADLAHELRTPVAGLLSRIEAAQDEVLPLEDNLGAMHADAERLTRLLDDLARLADAERPGIMIEKALVALAEVAGSVAASFAPRLAEAGISLTTRTEPAWVRGDAGRLEQVVANLVSNALRYTPAGGQVSVTVGRSGAECVLEVTDSGVGIAPEDLRHIFTRFWRADPSRSRATGGAGIGLAIVHELVRAHDGRIDVDSAPGRGSRFRVLLPAGDRDPDPDPDPDPHSPANAGTAGESSFDAGTGC